MRAMASPASTCSTYDRGQQVADRLDRRGLEHRQVEQREERQHALGERVRRRQVASTYARKPPPRTRTGQVVCRGRRAVRRGGEAREGPPAARRDVVRLVAEPPRKAARSSSTDTFTSARQAASPSANAREPSPRRGRRRGPRRSATPSSGSAARQRDAPTYLAEIAKRTPRRTRRRCPRSAAARTRRRQERAARPKTSAVSSFMKWAKVKRPWESHTTRATQARRGARLEPASAASAATATAANAAETKRPARTAACRSPSTRRAREGARRVHQEQRVLEVERPLPRDLLDLARLVRVVVEGHPRVPRVEEQQSGERREQERCARERLGARDAGERGRRAGGLARSRGHGGGSCHNPAAIASNATPHPGGFTRGHECPRPSLSAPDRRRRDGSGAAAAHSARRGRDRAGPREPLARRRGRGLRRARRARAAAAPRARGHRPDGPAGGVALRRVGGPRPRRSRSSCGGRRGSCSCAPGASSARRSRSKRPRSAPPGSCAPQAERGARRPRPSLDSPPFEGSPVSDERAPVLIGVAQRSVRPGDAPAGDLPLEGASDPVALLEAVARGALAGRRRRRRRARVRGHDRPRRLARLDAAQRAAPPRGAPRRLAAPGARDGRRRRGPARAPEPRRARRGARRDRRRPPRRRERDPELPPRAREGRPPRPLARRGRRADGGLGDEARPLAARGALRPRASLDDLPALRERAARPPRREPRRPPPPHGRADGALHARRRGEPPRVVPGGAERRGAREPSVRRTGWSRSRTRST